MRKERRDMNDKELDDFYRNKAAEPDIPYNPKDWEKMKALLDRPSPPVGINGSGQGNKNGWLLGFLALVITGAGLGWGYIRSGEEVTANENITLGTQVERPINKSDQIESAVIDSEEPPDAVAFPPDASALSDSVSTGSISKGENPEAGTPFRENGTNKRNQSNSFQSKTSGKVEAVAIKGINERIKNMDDQWSNQPAFLLDLSSTSEAVNLNYFFEGEKKNTNNSSGSREDKKFGKGSKFNVALSFAPDVTALKIKDIAGLGNSVGLNLEYFIYPNLSLNAGALYAFKTYRGGEGYYTGYIPAPTSVDGKCWVLDLPLNIRYYVINQRLGRWYVSTGVSSYLMLREKYDLHYSSYGGKGYEKQLDVKNNNRHFFDVFNLGLGYERVLTDKLALQVEPYLKLPINGIGEGSIDLKSAGALIGLKYRW